MGQEIRFRYLAAPLGQVAVMSAIVATLLYFPLGLALALALRIAGMSVHAWLTFGGALHAFFGLMAWWVLFFLGSCVYTACFFPWEETTEIR